ncbi:MAG: hypothetical protein HZA95_02905 [Candidatus Vogelbacteria bacterium]|nr:hypothetical protein [Candidatus Vogelbacteria bacterium]
MFEVVYSEDGKNMTQSCSLNYRLSCYNDQMDDAHYPPFLKTNWWLVAVTALIPAILAAATVGLFPNKPKDQDPLKLYTQ